MELTQLYQGLAKCQQKDVFRFKKRLAGIKKIADQSKQSAAFEKIANAIEHSIAVRAARLSAMPSVNYPENLPVSQKKDDIKEAIANNQVVIVAGETGSGKTTQLPKICLELGRGVDGFIGHTQPRRLAARSVANRIAEELNTELGKQVGFKIRFADNVSDESYVKLMTDGILLAEIQQDRFLNQYDTIIIDEAHERSLNIDFILGYLKNLLPKRPDLKLIITSATIDPERFSKHFNNAPIIEVSGRTYPVEVRYRPLTEIDTDDRDVEQDQVQGIIDAVDELANEAAGDILVFLNGEREIRDTLEALEKQNYRNTEILPLFARLSNAEQNRIFASHSGRRIVLSTNVAETSLTVPGIRYVIDPGTARISRYSYRTKVQRLPIEAVSQASANQRKGRCGRVADGICIRLYSEDDFNSRPEFTDPEILRTNLASVILQMLALGLGDISAFPFVEAPDTRNINDGFTLLEELQAISRSKKGRDVTLTELGKAISKLPVDPRLAKMVVSATQFDALKETIVIAAALSIQDPRERPQDKRQKADESHARFEDKDSDFIAFLNLWQYLEEQQQTLSRNQFRKLCQTEFLAYMRVREWQDIVYQLTQTCAELNMKVSDKVPDYQALHQAILAGMLSHIGFKQEDKSYLGARNAKFHIFPGSALFKKSPRWLMAAELVETSRLFARINAKIDVTWLPPLAEHLVKRSYSEPHWDKKAGVVKAFEKQTLYGLTIVQRKAVVYTKIDPTLCREIFIRSALVEQQLGQNEGFLHANAKLIDDVERLENKIRRRDILVDEETLVSFYDEKLPKDICNRAQFNHWFKAQKQKDKTYLVMTKDYLMRYDTQLNEDEYPDVWRQNNLLLPINYHFSPGDELDGVVVSVPLMLLNQVEDTGFDWHIRAFRHELITQLIKSLPKTTRRHFVPAPNYADALMQGLDHDKGNFIEAISKQLLRMSGVKISPEEWDKSTLPAHLQIQFEVVDENGKRIAFGRDISELKHKLSHKVSENLAQVADDGIEQQDLTQWTFAQLPVAYSKKQAGFEVKAFPALVDKKQSVAIELFDSERSAAFAHKLGVRRLLLLNIPSPIKYLQQKLPNKAKLALYFNPFGKVEDLINDCIAAAVDSFISHDNDVRDEHAFNALKERVRGELGDKVVEIALVVEELLRIANAINKRLKGKVDLTMILAQGDIKSQLDGLIFKGFVSHHGCTRLKDISRYLKAIEKRLEKLPIDPHQDKLKMLEIEKVTGEFEKVKSRINYQAMPSELLEVKWMIEELRVSLFAQTLGTAYPISAKRIVNALSEIN